MADAPHSKCGVRKGVRVQVPQRLRLGLIAQFGRAVHLQCTGRRFKSCWVHMAEIVPHGKKIPCPVKGCKRKCTTISELEEHLARDHSK
jgi:hypothetical protein